jgi:predicted enzyme related to lactoylglutathione lyase
MANITGILARVFVPDLDAAIPLYEELAQARAERFGFRDVELARVGPFLLLAGNTAAYRDRTATIQVADLAPVLAALESAGGEIVEGPAPAPNGARLIARHPDGAVFEYIETGDASLERYCQARRRSSGPQWAARGSPSAKAVRETATSGVCAVAPGTAGASSASFS